MGDILTIPPEFDTILAGPRNRGFQNAYEEPRLLPRPPLGPFTHHAVRTFAKTCSEGRIGLNWRGHLVCARETWQGLSAEEHSILQRAAQRDKQRYEESIALQPGTTEPADELSLLVLDKMKLAERGNALESGYELFKNSPETRPRLFDAKQGPIAYHEFYHDKVFIWLWSRIDEEERNHWRAEAKRRLEVANSVRQREGEEELVLNAEPPAPNETPSPSKRLRRARLSTTESPQNVDASGLPQRVDADEDEQEKASAEDESEPEQEEAVTADEQELSAEDHKEKAAATTSEVEDQVLTTDEKKTLESIPLTLPRWDRPPREARNAYTLYYTDKVTNQSSSGDFVAEHHFPTTRAILHADWQSSLETRRHYTALAKADQLQFDRQQKEHQEWQRAWWDNSSRILLHKVIDRWCPNQSFDAGQKREIKDPLFLSPGPYPGTDYRLPSLYYPVIRTDYSNDAIYNHIRHVLMNSEFEGDGIGMDLTFYDGLEEVSQEERMEGNETGLSVGMSLAREDIRARDREWCKGHLENKTVSELKQNFGELSFFGKEHVPIYTFGGHYYAIVVDEQSMRDGTVLFLSMNRYDSFLDSRPEFTDLNPDLGPGAWQEDLDKQWYLAPRMQAADVMIRLVNLDIANMSWDEGEEHRRDQNLDLCSDLRAQQWRGWQWAIEYVFGVYALENVVGVPESIPGEAFVDVDVEEEEMDRDDADGEEEMS